MTYFIFFIPLTLFFILIVMIRGQILSLKMELERQKEEILKLEENQNATKQSESIESSKKWDGLKKAFSATKTVDKDALSDRGRSR